MTVNRPIYEGGRITPKPSTPKADDRPEFCEDDFCRHDPCLTGLNDPEEDDDPTDEEEPEDEWTNREGMPEFNGSFR